MSGNAPTSTAWLVVGPPEHGVVILAEQLLRAMTGAHPEQPPVVVRAGDVDGLSEQLAAHPPDVATAHVHFTDRLFGADCASAAAAYRLLAGRLDAHGVRLGVTLHDLPLDPDDPARYRRRADAYAEVVAATTGPVIVSSGHEADLLAGFAPDVRPVVLPLPIDTDPADRGDTDPADRGDTRAADRGRPAPVPPPADVAILGYLYPGKGHAAALDALTALPLEVGLTVLGRSADGHDDLADGLSARARVLGRRLTVTGWIPDAELHAHLRGAVIPVVGHERMSASGSIGSWLSAGRRPLVPDGAYTRELAARCPGAVTTYVSTPQGLRDAIERAYLDPTSTWLAPGVVLGPSSAEVAHDYSQVIATANAR